MKKFFIIILFSFFSFILLADTETPTVTETPTPLSPTVEPTETGCVYRDGTFGRGGYFVYDAGMASEASSLVEDNNGKIVVGGYIGNEFAIWRLNGNGTLDSTFNGTGIYKMAVAGGPDIIDEIVVDGNNRIIGVGMSKDVSGKYRMFVIRLNSNGTLDTSFGSGAGYVSYGNAAGGNGNDYGYGLAIDAGGRIIVCGKSERTAGNYSMVIWRLNNDGTLDSTFNSNGKVVIDVGSGAGGEFENIKIDNSGKIVACGSLFNGTDYDMVVYRINSNGSLDTSFNGTGYLRHNNAAGGNSHDYGHVLTITMNGEILVGGQSASGTSDDVVVWKIKSNGELDTGFNNMGYVAFDNEENVYGLESGNGIMLSRNGIIVIGEGGGAVGTSDLSIWRFKLNGQIDANFNGNGYITHHNAAGGNGTDYGNKGIIDRNGRIVVAGMSRSAGYNSMVVWRYVDDCQVNLPANIKIFKSARGEEAKVGAKIFYTIEIKNDTFSDIYNLKVWDTLPEKVEYIKTVTGPQVEPDNNRLIIWDFSGDTLSAGQSLFIEFKVIITSLEPNGFITNRAGCDYNDDFYLAPLRHPSIFSNVSFYPLGVVAVYPNPFNPKTAINGKVKFANTIPGMFIRIFTISGEFVTSIKADSVITYWEGKNRFGCMISPGVYYYIIENPETGETIKGKLFVIY